MSRMIERLGPSLSSAVLALLLLLLLGTGAALPAAAQWPEMQAEGGDAPIRPGDLVRVRVNRHEDLSGDFPVTQFGVVTLPWMGDVDITRETHRSLRERVIRELTRTVVSPSIEVVVLRRIRVLGEVRQPGLFHLDPTMTVADALAVAGGLTPTARLGTVLLRRNGEVVVGDLRLDTRVADGQLQSGDEIVVPERAWLSRNGATVVTAGAAFAGIIVALFRN